MGAWGVHVFDDDTACDVRDDYQEFVDGGLNDAEAKRRLLAQYADGLDDVDDGPVIWVALAVTQWQLGRLDDDTKARAIAVIDTGAGLQRWEDEGPELLARRKAALVEVRAQLESPRPTHDL